MSNDSNIDLGRRRFVRTGAVAVTAIPLAAVLAQRAGVAQEKAQPGEALEYVEDASNTSNPARQEGAVCSNCQLYNKAEEADGFAPCPALANKLVAADGWCIAWVKVAG